MSPPTLPHFPPVYSPGCCAALPQGEGPRDRPQLEEGLGPPHHSLQEIQEPTEEQSEAPEFLSRREAVVCSLLPSTESFMPKECFFWFRVTVQFQKSLSRILTLAMERTLEPLTILPPLCLHSIKGLSILLSKVRVRLCPCNRLVPGLMITVEEAEYLHHTHLQHTHHLQGLRKKEQKCFSIIPSFNSASPPNS